MAGLNWLKVDASIFEHPKTRRLARALGISPEQTVGHLIRLWGWAMRIFPDGELKNIDADDLADAAHFDGEPGQFVEALLSCSSCGVGFLERREDGTLILHDWDEYSGALELKREKDRERKRNSAEAPKNSEAVRGIPKSSEEFHGIPATSTEENGTARNSTLREEKRREEKNREEYKNIRPFEPNIKQSGTAEKFDYDGEFERLWSVYPRKEGKAAAMKGYIAQRQNGVSFEEFARGLKGYLARLKAECTEPRYIKMGSTFFGPAAAWKDFLEGPPGGFGGMAEPQPPEQFEDERNFIAQNFGGDTNAYAKWLSAGSPDPAGEWYRRFCDNVSRRHHSEDPA